MSSVIARPPAGDELPSPLVGNGYRPHLDGLRAIAVYLVLLFHAGSSRFAGGFVGVDVFFVLSGYLVTQLLVRDLATGGAIRFGRFYARRFRRLLPAAFVALTVTAFVYVAIASPADVAVSLGGFKAAFLYVTNWFFISQSTAYFGGNIAQNPVLHFWSLAVEEQFYLFWPLLLGGGVAVCRRRGAAPWRRVRIAIAGGCAASLAWALLLRTTDPTHAYYGTDARAYQLLAGALLALTPGLVSGLRRMRPAAAFLAPLTLALLVALATSAVDLDAIERGIAVALVTCLVIVAVESDDGGPAQRLLASRPVVYLGKISYGTYLWHWPVILVIASSFTISPRATIAFTALVATALASLSFQLLEHPIRQSVALDAHRRSVIAAGLAISAVSALFLMPAILDHAESDAAVTVRTAGTAIPPGLDFANAVFQALPQPPICLGKEADACTIVRGTGRHILLLGDSHARMLIPTFMELARRENLTLSVMANGGCPWQRHLYTHIAEAPCRERKEDAYERVIPALKPDVIVAINFGYEDPVGIGIGVFGEDGELAVRGSEAFDNLLQTTTVASVSDLASSTGAALVIIEPIPRARDDENPTACLVRGKFLEDCRYVVSTQPTSLEQFYRRLDAYNPKLWSADFDRLVCPWLPVCDPVIAGHVVKI
ncbi:MAG: acyltransferase family protein, partial [bacterium]